MLVTRKYFVYKMKELWDVVRGILNRERDREAVEKHDRVVRFSEFHNKLDQIYNEIQDIKNKDKK